MCFPSFFFPLKSGSGLSAFPVHSHTPRHVCASLFLRVFFFSSISFQQIYPALAVIRSPRLHDVKPSGSAAAASRRCFSLSFLFARRNLAVQLGVETRCDRNGRSSARRNKSLTMKNHLEEMGRGFLLLRDLSMARYRNGRPAGIKVSTFGIDIESLLSVPLPLPKLMPVADTIFRISLVSRAL